MAKKRTQAPRPQSSIKGTTGTPTEATKHLQNTILAYRRDGWTFSAIAETLNYSTIYIQRLYKLALRAIIVDNVDELRKIEMVRLESLYQQVMEIANKAHVLVNSGVVVRDVIEDKDGKLIIDPETGMPVMLRLRDYGPQLAAIDRALKIMERKAKLLGLDMPTKIAATTPDGDKEAPFVQFYLPSNGRDDVIPDDHAD